MEQGFSGNIQVADICILGFQSGRSLATFRCDTDLKLGIENIRGRFLFEVGNLVGPLLQRSEFLFEVGNQVGPLLQSKYSEDNAALMWPTDTITNSFFIYSGESLKTTFGCELINIWYECPCACVVQRHV